MTTRLSIVLRAAALSGALVAGSLVAATPAQAYSYSCGTYWQPTTRELKRNCSSPDPGASFRVWTYCQSISSDASYRANGNWTINATSTVRCNVGYEIGSTSTQFA